MRPSNPLPGLADNPLRPLGQLAEWTAGTTVKVAIGLAIATIASRLMRSRHLHWSWAAAVLVCAVLARATLAGAATILGVAALGATVRSRRWHREDIDAGADLAEIAAARRGPLDALRSLTAAATLRRRRARDARDWFRGDELILGREDSGRIASIPFGGAGGGTHSLLVGATGSGKTVTQTWMAARAIEHGMAAIVVDPKGDRDMHREVRRAALTAGRPFIEWTPDGSSVYNPFARGSDTEIADKALAGERFTEPHYMRQAQRFLGHVVRALHKAGLEVSLKRLAHHLDPARLEMLVRSLPESDAASTHVYLDSLTARQLSDLSGVRDRLAILAESDVGQWLDPETSCTRRFDLLEAVRARAVVYFDLAADSRPLLTQMLGAAIVQDLQTTVAALQGRPIPTLAVIDEFSAIASEQVVRLFGRARSAGLSLVLSTQELADLRLPGRETLIEQVLGNLSVLIAHRQVVPASAELIGGLAGTRGAWRTSRHGDGRLTRTRTRDGVLHADEVMGLRPGHAAVVVLSGSGAPRIVRVFSPGA